jgi:transcriptional regulator with XRE-family HTH domain
VPFFDKKIKKRYMPNGIGLRIKELREKLNLTQIEFSNKICIKQANLSHIENKSEKISLDIVNKIISNFNINANWLLTGKGEMLRENGNNNIGNGQQIIANHVQGGINADNRQYYSSTDVLRSQIEEKNKLLAEKDLLLKEKDERLREKDERLREKDEYIKELKETIKELKNK